MDLMIVGLYHRVALYSCFEVSQLCLSIRSCFYFVLSNGSVLWTKMFGVFFGIRENNYVTKTMFLFALFAFSILLFEVS